MRTGPRGVDEGDVGDGLVFVSYSHADAVWAQRFRVLLKPLVRYERLRLWDDTEIRATQEWHPAIREAITRSRVALLLISADFLASDCIMDHELPLLVEREVGLAPVLIADCFWRAVPQLAAVQFLHDIGRDGALSRHAGNPGARDRWIRRACERLLEVVPEPDLGHRSLAKVGRAPGPTWDPVVIPDDDVAGPLSRVPEPPPGYVVREELDGLVSAVLSTAGRGAVGLVPERPWTGLYGIGGIGKSVLAAAVAADGRVRRRHPDGVFWVTVGERADLLALQLDLLARLGAPADVRTVAEATRALRTALADKRVPYCGPRPTRCPTTPTARWPRSVTSRSRWRCSRQRCRAAAPGPRSTSTSVATPTSTAPTPTPTPSAPCRSVPQRCPTTCVRRCSASRSSPRTPRSRSRRSPGTGRTPAATPMRGRSGTSTASPPPTSSVARATPSASTTTPTSTCSCTPTVSPCCTGSSWPPTARCCLRRASGGSSPRTSRTCGSTSRGTSPVPEPDRRSPPPSPIPPTQARRVARGGPHAGEADLALAARVVPGDPAVSWWRN